MGEKMKWTPEKIAKAKEIFGQHRHLEEAMPRIRVNFGEAYLTLDAVRRAFSRAGLPGLRSWLKTGPVKIAELPKDDRVPGATAETSYDKPKVGPLSWTKAQVDAFNEADVNMLTSKIRAELASNVRLLDAIRTGKVKVQVVNTEVNKKTTRILIVSDLHAPYQDVDAWNCVLQVIRETKPATVVIIGDFADCLAISSHPKSLDRKHDFAAEVEGVNLALDELRLAAGNDCRIIYTAGNHEDRITRYLQSSAPELGGIKELRAEGLFKIKERNIEWVPYRRSIKIGNCSFTHDVGRCGVNTARQSLMDWGGNLVVGHSHRGGVAYQGESKGSSHFCLNVGWLGDVDGIDYQHRMRVLRDHQCGFGIVDQDDSGCSWSQFIPVLDGRCIVDGKVISAQKAAA